MRTTLVVQSFGREKEYKRAILTILSYYAHTSLPVEQTKVVLFTDKPEYFSLYLKGLPIQNVLLNPGKITEMRGKIDFLHRMKIAIIEEAFSIVGDNIIYADSDTFFVGDATPLFSCLNSDTSFMHTREFAFEEIRDLALPAGKTSRDFVALIESVPIYLANGQPVKVTGKQISWNAGVMFLDVSHARFIDDVYALTDQFYPATQHHASEQFAFSIILQTNTEVRPCSAVIYHYWYRVKKDIVDLFLASRLNDGWCFLDLGAKLYAVKEWCNMLPDYLDHHILTLRDKAIQAFNEDEFVSGYKFALRALWKDPIDKAFFKHLLHHTKRNFQRKLN